MKKAAIAFVVASVFGMTACQQKADPLLVEETKLETEEQKQAYAFGASIGGFVEQKLEQQESMNVEMDKALIVKGFVAALQGKSALDKTEIQRLNNAFDKVLEQAAVAKAESDLVLSAKWLEDNAKNNENVVQTESGLQYEVLISSEGDKPVAQDTVKVHYRGTLVNGKEFDSSYSRNEPTTFPLNRVIKGWTEGLQLMTVGSKYKFYIPSELGYGQRGAGQDIPPNSTLIFEVELLEIMNKPASN